MRLLQLEDEVLRVRDIYRCSTYSSCNNDQSKDDKVVNLVWHLLPYPTFE